MTTAESAGAGGAEPGGSGAHAAVKSAVRTVLLLEHFAARPGLHSLADIQHDLSLPKSSLYMLLRTLVNLGWVETDATGTRYGIGVRALLVGSSYIDGDEVVAAARPTLDRLSDDTTETIHLARMDGTSVVYLATRQSRHHLRPFTRVGRRLPAHSTALGKALLATHTDDEVRRLLPRRLEAVTEHTITDRDRLVDELALVREQGYAVDREESTLGLRCFGVAVPYRTPARDAVSCSVPVARLTDGHEHLIKAALFEARDRLSVVTRRM
ncbi:IclR family transcriptional regulator [Streptomyces sp. NPDC054949]|uniref:IclR family transcriptional regulator n=1 Tax=unclassified Streptomyces TaxID=2593676 RepID=UPI0006AE836F|nr:MULTISPECIES: IclR family transcriptional regulator [unclassified Streptomyces]KOU54963.1 IclR family transcriptional regulator [Streptomyces sp. WM4235]MCX5076073.1 IclR family transcriptional regulator [Streptomyces sp. NBC_00424]MCX5156113.1 IclR family transcriptional regulator [Streptomyces sp. NBC_00291]WUD40864.1 IclR family transcriptional regulator [Streptomyces sp. NBC_00513]